jgi:hypothetical protein
MKADFSSVDIAVEKVIAKHDFMFRVHMLMKKPAEGHWGAFIKANALCFIVRDYKQKLFALNAKKEVKPAVVYEVRGHNSLITGKMLEDFLNANASSST